ncbi:hypothetical protein [Salipiger bermudensis]
MTQDPRILGFDTIIRNGLPIIADIFSADIANTGLPGTKAGSARTLEGA